MGGSWHLAEAARSVGGFLPQYQPRPLGTNATLKKGQMQCEVVKLMQFIEAKIAIFHLQFQKPVFVANPLKCKVTTFLQN